MPIQVSEEVLPAWADGDHVLYNEYVMKVASGKVLQLATGCFMFRSNLRTDILNWLIEDCVHDGELRTNSAGYLSHVVFFNPTGAMDFKLRWM